MVTELIWATDRFSLYDELERQNEDVTISIRHTLWLTTTGVLKNGKIFVDRYPDPNFVCCLHSTKIYAPNGDRDFVSVAETNPNKNLVQNRDESALKFFNALIVERQWKNRDGVIFFYVTDPWVELAQKILCPKPNGDIWISKPLRHYTACERKNLPEYEKRMNSYWKKIDPNLVIDKLKPEDGPLVAAQWPYEVPDKAAMFSWLATFMPSVCIRDPKTGQPLSWVTTYTNAASGAAFVQPEYRGRHFNEAQAFQLSVDLAKLSPSKRFFWILDENVISQKNAKKIYFDWIRSDLFVRIFVYDSPNGMAKKTKAKM